MSLVHDIVELEQHQQGGRDEPELEPAAGELPPATEPGAGPWPDDEVTVLKPELPEDVQPPAGRGFGQDEPTRIFERANGSQFVPSPFSSELTRIFHKTDARRRRSELRPGAPPPPPPAAPPREQPKPLSDVNEPVPQRPPPLLRSRALLPLSSDPTPNPPQASSSPSSVPVASHRPAPKLGRLAPGGGVEWISSEPTRIAPASATPQPSVSLASSDSIVEAPSAEAAPVDAAHLTLTTAVTSLTPLPAAATKKGRPLWLKLSVAVAFLVFGGAAWGFRGGKVTARGTDSACRALGTCGRAASSQSVGSAAGAAPSAAESSTPTDPMAGPIQADATPKSAIGHLLSGDTDAALRSYRGLAQQDPSNEAYRTLVRVLFQRSVGRGAPGEGG